VKQRMAALFWMLMLSGCAGRQQSMVDPAGPQASRIEGLWWFFFDLLGAIFVIVIAVMLWALTRRDRGNMPTAPTEGRMTRVVAGATIATVIILFGLLVLSVSTGKAISDTAKGTRLAIEIVGNQWWWYVRYLNDDPSRIVVTANELHIPAGVPVMIRLSSNDVIHSFWVPNLHGKRDLIPSKVRQEWIQADHPGKFRGQCAEFCGLQHAHMAMWVVAEPEDQFDAWMENQRQPAVRPADAQTQRGQHVFLSHACVFCHTIAGTPAAGQNGPDLTHLASRTTIAAGTLPNVKGNLGGWISDPQNIKPGAHMPAIEVSADDVQPLLDYLESLR
jgi:cytochrome c oxidase subunit 2